MYYKNLSGCTRTFYGVTFAPGEEHYVPGYINCAKFVRVEAPVVEETIKPVKKASTTKQNRLIKEESADGTD